MRVSWEGTIASGGGLHERKEGRPLGLARAGYAGCWAVGPADVWVRWIFGPSW